MDKLSERRLAENEVIFREANRDIQKFVKGEENGGRTLINFYCECSRPKCRERITLTVDTYDELHKNKRQFISIPGHEVPEVERVIRKEDGFSVIEKFADPPAPEEIDQAVKNIKL